LFCAYTFCDSNILQEVLWEKMELSDVTDHEEQKEEEDVNRRLLNSLAKKWSLNKYLLKKYISYRLEFPTSHIPDIKTPPPQLV